MHELVTRYDLQAVKDDLGTVRRELQTAIDTSRRELEAKIDTLSLRLTVRMGVMFAAGLSILAVVLKLHS